ncbi:uncharacterized protein LOC119867493 isoform X1 [Canis lupus familiaris]|uniref:uncharacterized protein LOC119867493 isoform X1 n=1 Tax=Canis lupus familiaris TaxID=9615 RepID=UPI0018F63C8C|nr:uncharacterized protein LOC119867493 isoform X1 [Canis lupus familiaris]XP_038301572.1 uncharacterized protein LOC119867493 isoform X1 [Canis lupus familiaris]XP_038301573.1 uncharacterized protein LOC119867493 isoform X1 [Canis lupus familiaris]XP_038301574.1 uncharacterized protein LOC119867493 isoform X1 [Canis lupus familiaris]XP_038439396.1 uncharacterized protein LOC119867493 isoform X1 [Canis lupus familiaris]XP_038439397.1 uncharacterized protein LOC119867493 isoform X1 [Canis lupus
MEDHKGPRGVVSQKVWLSGALRLQPRVARGKKTSALFLRGREAWARDGSGDRQAALTMAPARLRGLHRERGSSQPKGRSQLARFYPTAKRPPPAADANRPASGASGNTAAGRPTGRKTVVNGARGGPEGKGRWSSGQVQKAPGDWLAAGGPPPSSGSELGLLRFALGYQAEGIWKLLSGKLLMTASIP